MPGESSLRSAFAQATACAFRNLDELTAAYRLRAMMLRDYCADRIAKHKPNHQM